MEAAGRDTMPPEGANEGAVDAVEDRETMVRRVSDKEELAAVAHEAQASWVTELSTGRSSTTKGCDRSERVADGSRVAEPRDLIPHDAVGTTVTHPQLLTVLP